jgi:nucleoside-diphosphate-sugar epimerase
MKRILIVGAGDVASRMLPWLTRLCKVRALVRRPEAMRAWRHGGAIPVLGDLDEPASLQRIQGIADWVVHCAPPASQGEHDVRTRHLLAALAGGASLPQRLIYISTTGVYGDWGGRQGDECQPARPVTVRARRRVDAEQQIRSWGRRLGVKCIILRAPGIYAGDRLPLARLQRGDPVLLRDEDVFTNHIHAEDLARLLWWGLVHGQAGRVYNAVDDSDMLLGDYFDLVAQHAGLPLPPRCSAEELRARISPLALSFMSESRRIANRRVHAELRYRFLYPSVADGLRLALRD